MSDGEYASAQHEGARASAVPVLECRGLRKTYVSGPLEVPVLMGIDLDACVDAKLIKPWAIEVLDRFDTYAEVSPSGKGIKLF